MLDITDWLRQTLAALDSSRPIVNGPLSSLWGVSGYRRFFYHPSKPSCNYFSPLPSSNRGDKREKVRDTRSEGEIMKVRRTRSEGGGNCEGHREKIWLKVIVRTWEEEGNSEGRNHKVRGRNYEWRSASQGQRGEVTVKVVGTRSEGETMSERQQHKVTGRSQRTVTVL